MKKLIKTKISVCFNNIIAIMKQKYASTYQEKAKKRLISLHAGDPTETSNSAQLAHIEVNLRCCSAMYQKST